MTTYEHQSIMPRNLETASAVKLCHITLLSSLLMDLSQIHQCLFQLPIVIRGECDKALDNLAL